MNSGLLANVIWLFCIYIPDVINQPSIFIPSVGGTAPSAIRLTPIESFVSLRNEAKQDLSRLYLPPQNN